MFPVEIATSVWHELHSTCVCIVLHIQKYPQITIHAALFSCVFYIWATRGLCMAYVNILFNMVQGIIWICTCILQMLLF